jgi:hypothetical protein
MSNIQSVGELSGVLGDDLPCVKCRYNLRSLAREGRCPECGTAVGESVRYAGLDFSRLMRGLRLLALLPVLKVLVVGIYFVEVVSRSITLGYVSVGVLLGVLLLHPVLFCWAVALLARAKPLGGKRRVSRAVCFAYGAAPLLVIATYLALAGCLKLGWISELIAEENVWIFDAVCVGVIVFALGRVSAAFIGWRYMGDLAKRLGRRWLSILATTLLVLSVVISSIGILYWAGNLKFALERGHPIFWDWNPWAGMAALSALAIMAALFALELIVQFVLWLFTALIVRRVWQAHSR